jgi:hypothetical protein
MLAKIARKRRLAGAPHRQEANAMNIAVKPEAAAPEDVQAIPLAELNPARTDRFQNDTIDRKSTRLNSSH